MKITGTIIAQVYETRDYDAFRRLEANRGVGENRKEKLIASFKAGEVLNPIVVNEKMEIIDGQGRYEARKELGLPIQYVISVGSGIDECRRMNQYNTKWTEEDWVNSYVEGENQNYIVLKSVHEQTHAPYKRILRLCNKSGGDTGSTIKNGTLAFAENDGDVVKRILRQCDEITEALAFTGRRNDAFFVAVKVASETEGYDHERMIRNCKNCRSSYNQMSGLEAQLKEFSRIYNYRAGGRQKVYFERYMDNRGCNVRDYEKKQERRNVSTLK